MRSRICKLPDRRICGEARTPEHSLQWIIELRSSKRKIMTSLLESLIQQATQLERLAVCDSNRDERIELITHVANSLHSSNDPTSETVLTDIQQSQLAQLRSEIEIGLEQARAGDTVDGETVFANLRTRIDSYREPK
jgi:predicted transcriptional regulator